MFCNENFYSIINVSVTGLHMLDEYMQSQLVLSVSLQFSVTLIFRRDFLWVLLLKKILMEKFFVSFCL